MKLFPRIFLCICYVVRLFLVQGIAMKTYRGKMFNITILDLGIRWRWVVSTPIPLNPQERVPDTHWTGGWVGNRTNLDAVKNWKVSCPHREQNPGRSVRIPSQISKRFIVSESNFKLGQERKQFLHMSTFLWIIIAVLLGSVFKSLVPIWRLRSDWNQCVLLSPTRIYLCDDG
jgi:hypothetical protein